VTPEGIVKKKIRALLKAYRNVHVDMPVQNGMGSPMLDFHVCVAGWYLAIEAKRKGGKTTPRQDATIMLLRKAGATVFVIEDDLGLLELEAYLNARTSRKAVGGAEPAEPADSTEHDPDGET
jgi:hypothetical protein